MAGDSGERLRRYHEATKHSVESLRSSSHALDWENQPLPFKVYTEIAGEPLPLDVTPSGVSTLEAISNPPQPTRAGSELDRAAIARLLHFSLGIVRRRKLPGGGTIGFRAAPCTGALYHVDAYVVCGELRELPAGVWHFGPHDFSLRRLRAGDFRATLRQASGDEPQVADAPATLVLASTYWRNAWKYRSRAYRHVFWDAGTILAQLLAQAGADRWFARVVTGFADSPVVDLLGLDPAREGAIALVPLGAGMPCGDVPAPGPLRQPTRPLSAREVDYPMIPEAHAASSLADGEAAVRWRTCAPVQVVHEPRGPVFPLPPPSDPGEPLERVILRRGSARIFARRPIPATALSMLLAAADAPLRADYRVEPASPLVEAFVIVHAVVGIPPGIYRWHRSRGVLEQLAAGELRHEAGFLGLGQELPAGAAVNVYWIADLALVLGALGGRGYRAAQLDGAIAGGRAYLAAYAEGLGATGLTFFDDDVSRFFGLDPERFGVMFLVAAGEKLRP